MSSANHKRGPLEEELQRRLHDAEAKPSPDIWARIDHDLTVEESKHYKNRMVFYRQLAAACIALLVIAGTVITFHLKEDKKSTIASVSHVASTPEPDKQIANTEGQSSIGGITAKLQINKTNSSKITEASKTLIEELEPGVKIASPKNKGSIAVMSKDNDQNSGLGSRAETEAEEKDGEFNEKAIAAEFKKPFYKTAKQAIASVPSSFSENNQTSERTILQINKASEANVVTQNPDQLAMAINDVPGNNHKEIENTESNRWTLGVGYAPSYFDQNIGMPNQMMGTVSRFSLVSSGPSTSTSSDANMEKARDEFEANTDPAFSFAAEVKSGFKLNKHLRVLAGLGFTQNTSRTKSSYIIEQFLYKPNTKERVAMPATTVFLPSLNNNFTTDSLSVTKTNGFYVNYRYRHLTVPVGLQYEGQINKDWFWYTAGGAAANFLVETTVMASNNAVREVSYGYREESPFRKVQFSGNVSLGVGKRIAQAMSVTVGPEFRGYLNSLVAEPQKALAPQGKPYMFGVNMSVSYDLGKK
jgi:hypothetical protein